MQFFGNEHTVVMVKTPECRFILLQDGSGSSVVAARSMRAGRRLMDKSNGV